MTGVGQRTKILGLYLLAGLAATASFTPTAEGGEYRVGGGTFAAKEVTEKSGTGTAEAGELVVESGLEIACNGSSISGTYLQGGVAHLSVLFNKCEVLNNPTCLVYESKMDDELGINSGNILVAGLGEVVLHGIKTHYFRAANLETILWIGNHLGKKLCVLPLENLISGSTAFLLPTALKDLLSQTAETLNAAGRTLLVVQLLYGGMKAFLKEGSKASVRLTSDELWGVE